MDFKWLTDWIQSQRQAATESEAYVRRQAIDAAHLPGQFIENVGGAVGGAASNAWNAYSENYPFQAQLLQGLAKRALTAVPVTDAAVAAGQSFVNNTNDPVALAALKALGAGGGQFAESVVGAINPFAPVPEPRSFSEIQGLPGYAKVIGDLGTGLIGLDSLVNLGVNAGRAAARGAVHGAESGLTPLLRKAAADLPVGVAGEEPAKALANAVLNVPVGVYGEAADASTIRNMISTLDSGGEKWVSKMGGNPAEVRAIANEAEGKSFRELQRSLVDNGGLTNAQAEIFLNGSGLDSPSGKIEIIGDAVVPTGPAVVTEQTDVGEALKPVYHVVSGYDPSARGGFGRFDVVANGDMGTGGQSIHGPVIWLAEDPSVALNATANGSPMSMNAIFELTSSPALQAIGEDYARAGVRSWRIGKYVDSPVVRVQYTTIRNPYNMEVMPPDEILNELLPFYSAQVGAQPGTLTLDNLKKTIQDYVDTGWNNHWHDKDAYYHFLRNELFSGDAALTNRYLQAKGYDALTGTSAEASLTTGLNRRVYAVFRPEDVLNFDDIEISLARGIKNGTLDINDPEVQRWMDVASSRSDTPITDPAGYTKSQDYEPGKIDTTGSVPTTVTPMKSEWQIMDKVVSGQKGSNEGGLYTGIDGINRYAKIYNDPAQAYGENLANIIYNATSTDAPRGMMFTANDGRIGYASEWISGAVNFAKQSDMTKEQARKVLEAFPTDVLLANWDVFGQNLDNLVRVGPDSPVVRIDNGSALLSRAMGARKPERVLGSATEWDSFFDPQKNPSYSRVLKIARYDSPEDFAVTILSGVSKLNKLESEVDGWENFVRKFAPGLDENDKLAMAEMLYSRLNDLNDRALKLAKSVGSDWNLGDMGLMTPSLSGPVALGEPVALFDPKLLGGPQPIHPTPASGTPADYDPNEIADIILSGQFDKLGELTKH